MTTPITGNSRSRDEKLERAGCHGSRLKATLTFGQRGDNDLVGS